MKNTRLFMTGKLGRASLLIVFIFLLFDPFIFSNAADVTIVIAGLLLATATIGWNIFSGYTGYLSLGFSTYSGLGVYTLMLLYEKLHIPSGYIPFALLPLTGLVAALFSILLGWLSLRTRRETFVVITLATLFIFQLLAINLPSITHGNNGFFFDQPPWQGDFYNYPFYYVSLVMLVLAFLVAWWIRHSKYGLGLLAIREDEERARSLGIKTGAYKLWAFAISAFFGGMVGAMTVYFNGAIKPTIAFDPAFDVVPVLMAFLGGSGTLSGPLVGAVVYQLISAYFIPPATNILATSLGHDLDPGYLNLVVTGLFLLLVLLFLPEGIVPGLKKLWLKLLNSSHQQRQRTNAETGSQKDPVALLAKNGKGDE